MVSAKSSRAVASKAYVRFVLKRTWRPDNQRSRQRRRFTLAGRLAIADASADHAIRERALLGRGAIDAAARQFAPGCVPAFLLNGMAYMPQH